VTDRGAPREPAFEEEAFLQRVAAIFHGLERDYVAHIPAGGEVEAVHRRVVAEVRSRLGLC
jgi:hypothetical protein